MLLGMNRVHPTFWQMLPVKLKIPSTQQYLIQTWHFLNTLIAVEQTLLSQGLERESRCLGPARLAGQEPG